MPRVTEAGRSDGLRAQLTIVYGLGVGTPSKRPGVNPEAGVVRPVPLPGEVEVCIRCGNVTPQRRRCDRVLARAWGHIGADGPRLVGGYPVSPETMLDTVGTAAYRVKFRCHPACGATPQVVSEKLGAVFRIASAQPANKRLITVPDDIAGLAVPVAHTDCYVGWSPPLVDLTLRDRQHPAWAAAARRRPRSHGDEPYPWETIPMEPLDEGKR